MKKENKNLGAFLSEYGVFIALAILVVVISAISPEFRQPGNFLNLLRQASFNGLIAFGMTCVILSGGIDLSVGSTFALSAIVCAEMIGHGVPVIVAVPVALLVGVALGLISGLLVTKGRLQPFIATLITMTAYRGLAMILTDGKPISRLAESSGDSLLFKALGKGNVVCDFLPAIKIPIPILILLASFGIFYFLLKHTTFGRRLYATGSNAKCAALSGVNIDRVKMSVYGISGFLSALAGLIMISRVDSAQPIMGSGYELDAIAAVALGGTSMNGGRGRITGTIAGVLIIAVLNNGLNILGVTSYYQNVIKAVVILVAVLADRKR
ncbi:MULTISPECIES: ABC transporter permease [unclassified Fibrobacter]|uniref:ABC transporter permease n=1 Tax=unclassified Fibrobacter TaxID=2634177 RepID=UPI00091F5DB7|nr:MULTISPECIES: ribose ABC transporter permease [unclassified Fibrobacter]MDO4946150.1 ribose ABC transporter permease [Fibrobacter sp.]OWV04740.1 ribose ABC transporter permease [Fibrobacter sp. UWH3]SHL16135.1 ribose ABC transporter membrane protein [Fibrobacter sp. UWH6]